MVIVIYFYKIMYHTYNGQDLFMFHVFQENQDIAQVCHGNGSLVLAAVIS